MSQKKTKRSSRQQEARGFNWAPYLIALGLVIVAGLVFAVLRKDNTPQAEIEVNGAPSLEVDQEQIDLGDMKFNQVADVSFRVTNVGDQRLRFAESPYVEVVEGC